MAHKLQLILSDAVRKSKPPQSAIEKLAKIFGKLKKSCKVSEVVEKKFGRAFLVSENNCYSLYSKFQYFCSWSKSSWVLRSATRFQIAAYSYPTMP